MTTYPFFAGIDKKYPIRVEKVPVFAGIKQVPVFPSGYRENTRSVLNKYPFFTSFDNVLYPFLVSFDKDKYFSFACVYKLKYQFVDKNKKFFSITIWEIAQKLQTIF